MSQLRGAEEEERAIRICDVLEVPREKVGDGDQADVGHLERDEDEVVVRSLRRGNARHGASTRIRHIATFQPEPMSRLVGDCGEADLVERGHRRQMRVVSSFDRFEQLLMKAEGQEDDVGWVRLRDAKRRAEGGFGPRRAGCVRRLGFKNEVRSKRSLQRSN